MHKDRLTCPSNRIREVLARLRRAYEGAPSTLATGEGDHARRLVLVRGSNTEPILRVVAEAPSEQAATRLLTTVRSQVTNWIDAR